MKYDSLKKMQSFLCNGICKDGFKTSVSFGLMLHFKLQIFFFLTKKKQSGFPIEFLYSS